MALKGKMQAYAEGRANGMEPRAAAAHAGYSGAGVKVVTCRLEQRDDVKKEIQRLRKGGEAPSHDDDPEAWAMKDRYGSPLELFLDVMNNPKAPKSLRHQAAKDAAPYCHARKEGGKKDEKDKAAKKAAAGRFGSLEKPSHLQKRVN